MHSWAIDQQGFCFSTNIFVKILPKLNFENYEIMGFFHKINDQDYLITDYDGEISAVGQNISELFGLKPSEILAYKINLQLFCPHLFHKFIDYFTDFEDTYELTVDKREKLSVLGNDPNAM